MPRAGGIEYRGTRVHVPNELGYIIRDRHNIPGLALAAPNPPGRNLRLRPVVSRSKSPSIERVGMLQHGGT